MSKAIKKNDFYMEETISNIIKKAVDYLSTAFFMTRTGFEPVLPP